MASNTRIVAARFNTVLARCHRGLGTIAFMPLVGSCIVLALAQSETTPRHLDDGRQWLDSPAGVTASSPALIRAAASSALGDGVTAERLLRGVIRARPLSHDAGEAHELLSRLYLRSGQYDRLFRNFAAWERNFPSSPAVREERTDIEFLRGLPDQRNGPRRASTLTHEAGDDFSVPVTVNGRTARYLLDTGAWASLITAGEAKRLGLRVRPGLGRIGDASGQGASVRTAVVDDLRLGSMRFRQVSFLVLDSEEQAGILGMPVMLATGRVHWSVGGTWELGRPE